MGDSQQLSRPAAIVVGTLTIACGAIPLVLIARGDVRPSTPSDAPTWLGVAIALVFVFAGFSVIFDYVIGHGRQSDGGFLPDTPAYIRALDTLIGLGILGLMAAIFGWVAFGRGPRAFSTFVAIPFLAVGSRAGELSGRIAFGVFAVLWVMLFMAFGVSAVRRIRRTVRR